MNYLEILLKQLHLQDDACFDQAYLRKVKVRKDGHYTFIIDTETLLPLDNVLKLIDSKEQFPYPCEFIFEAKEDIKQNTILEYTFYIINELGKKYPELKNISSSSYSYQDGLLTIKAVSDLQKTQIEELQSAITHYFHRFGINIGLLITVDNQNENYNALVEEMTQDNLVLVEKDKLEKAKSSAHNTPINNYRSYKKDYQTIRLNEIDSTMRDVMIEGYCFRSETVTTRKGKDIQTLYITDYTDSIMVKRFEDKNRNTKDEMGKAAKGGVWMIIKGTLEFDTFAKEQIIIAREVNIEETPPAKAPESRRDHAKEKRIELSIHTNMSTLDGIGNVNDYIQTALRFGHEALAITDRGNVQAFPDAALSAKGKDIKLIYGAELNMIDIDFKSVFNEKSIPFDDMTYVSFDLETTGLSQIEDYITEFGAVKIRNGMVIDRFQSFVKSPKPITHRITELTSITNEMIKNAPVIENLMPRILEFFGDNLLVAHNGRFDIGMLNMALSRMGQSSISNTWVDSLPLARHLIPMMRSYRLGAVCGFYKIAYNGEEAHRADYDAEVLGMAFDAMIDDMKKRSLKNINELNSLPLEDAYKHAFPYTIDILAKNQKGLKNLYKIISLASTVYFSRNARIPQDELIKYHEGLLFGTSGINSRVFEIAATRNEEELREELRFYDYVEIQPLIDAQCYVERGRFESLKEVEKIYSRIIDCAKKENKIIVATGDVHFIHPTDKIYRDAFISNPKLQIEGRPHPLCVRTNPHALTPDCYYRTTEEMLECFPYLSKKDTYQYVVTNTHKIAESIDKNVEVVKSGLYPPFIENVNEKFRDLCNKTAHETYGDVLPEEVKTRLDFEVDNIIKHSFAVIYYISAMLVHESNNDGYLVGSRGSVGSSFAATMSGISEVNPLPPHYHCPNCRYSEFTNSVANGFDLPDKKCPVCGTYMKGDGHNIPFETFLGFNGDKVPDIDLNFSGEYQPKAHEFVRKMFGSDHAFRAGTIATVAEKTAYGYAKAYAERMEIDSTIRGAELQRIADGCQGVKRTTGQHPAGIIVIPDGMEVFDFTPYQYPADDVNASWRTTHFDFHKIHDNVLKFDILGHVDPTVTRRLQDLTGVDPMTIPTNDPYVMSLFRTSDALGADLSYMNCKSGAIGLPEFGTRFVRSMLEATQPKSFSDLVIISGLSHGTDVYLGNAETLIKTGTCTLSNVIGCRDDIMVYLIEKGLPNKDAFDIMETTRKGKAAKVFPEKGYVELMKKHNVPQWYIDSCLKIKYMFPKAHAAAYVYSALRIAWWKVYYPREYYTVYFTTRCDAYEIETLIQGKQATLARYEEILKLKSDNNASNKDEALITVFEVAMEMFDRGYRFANISLEKSDGHQFRLDPDDYRSIIPPFTSIEGLGDSVGDSIVSARREHEFTSIEDVKGRTRLSNTHLDILKAMGVFDHLSESNQLSIFDL